MTSPGNAVAELLQVPWKPCGRTREGADCVGMVILYAATLGIEIPPFDRTPYGVRAADFQSCLDPLGDIKEPGYCILFANPQGKLFHCAVTTKEGRFLHATYGGARLDPNLVLMQRIGLTPVGKVPLADTERLTRALRESGVGWVAAILIAIAVVSLVASVLLMPKLGNNVGTPGRYGFDGLETTATGEVPVPDLLGKTWLAGNLIYNEMSDQNQAVSTPSAQVASHIVAFASGPLTDFGFATYEFRLNGYGWDNSYWFYDGSTGVSGFKVNPTQDKANAVLGNIGSETSMPSVTVYDGSAITPPVDVRAQYIRTAPLYGFKGLGYAYFRLFDSTKYGSFNLLCRITGRAVRQFTTAGWVRTTVTNEAVGTGDGATVLWPLAHRDIEAVSAVTVGGTTYTLLSATNQGSQTYWLNKTYGYLQFTTAPASSAAIVCSYDYFPRAFTQDPASHIAYLLTELYRGKGLPETKIDWQSFVDAQTYFADTLTTPDIWNSIVYDNAYNSTGGAFDPLVATPPDSGSRYTTNYVLDARQSVLDHLKALTDACASSLVLAGGLIKLKTTQPGTSIASFNASNILEKTFQAELLDRTDRANRLVCTYRDASLFSAQVAVHVDDALDQQSRLGIAGNGGVIEQALSFPAVDSPSQAFRLGSQTVTELTQVHWQGKFTTTLIGLPLEPGDIIDITYPSMPTWQAKLARVDQIDHDAQDRLVVSWSEYQPLPYAQPVAPLITSQPANDTFTVGGPISFSVVARGVGPLTYQWYKGGVAIGGATSATYTIATAASGDAGNYTVIVTGAGGSTTSATAVAAVFSDPILAASPIFYFDPAHVTTSSGNITAFADQSGNGYNGVNSGTVALGAGINSQPTANFTGSSGSLLTSSNLPISGTTPFRIICVAQMTVVPGGTMIVGTLAQSYGHNFQIADYGGTWQINTSAAAWNGNAQDTNPHVLDLTFDGTNFDFKIDGTSMSGFPASAGGYTQAAGPLILGVGAYGSGPLQGYIGKVAVFSSLTSGQASAITSALRTQYGI